MRGEGENQSKITIGGRNEHGMGWRTTGGGFNLGGIRTSAGPVNDTIDPDVVVDPSGSLGNTLPATVRPAGPSNDGTPLVAYPGGIGRQDQGADRQTTTTYADGTMVPVVTRTTNRMWALGQMQLEESRQASVHEPSEIARQAFDMAFAPQGTKYEGAAVWDMLGLVEAKQRDKSVDPATKAQLTTAWRSVYQRGHTEGVLGMPSAARNFPAQFKEDALGAFGGSNVRGPRIATSNVLPTTKAGHAAYRIGGGWPGTGGSGPVKGTIGITNETSTAALKNYYPAGGGVEFVYDPATSTFVAGRPARGQFDGSPHQQLAQSINASDEKVVVGGTFTRGPNGEFLTTENSGHYGQNWTDPVRAQFQTWLSSRVGKPVNHQNWGK